MVGRVHNASDSRGGIEITVSLKDRKGIRLFLEGAMWFSPEIQILEGECSICHKSIFDCNEHIPGMTYDGKEAFIIVKRLKYLGASLVNKPEDPFCFVKYIIIKDFNFNPVKIFIIEIIPNPEDVGEKIRYLHEKQGVISDWEFKNADIEYISINEVFKQFFSNKLGKYI